jgi:hypothetical protein
MANWKSLVASFFRNSDPEGEFRHLTGPPASNAALATVEARIGVSIPEELRSLYLLYNGIGMQADGEADTPRLIRPIEDLPDFMAECRSTFSDTHPDAASRFFPFLDWINGDVMGYMLQEDGKFCPFLVTFMHELYRHSASQDIDEFLERGPESLVALFSP